MRKMNKNIKSMFLIISLLMIFLSITTISAIDISDDTQSLNTNTFTKENIITTETIQTPYEEPVKTNINDNKVQTEDNLNKNDYSSNKIIKKDENNFNSEDNYTLNLGHKEPSYMYNNDWDYTIWWYAVEEYDTNIDGNVIHHSDFVYDGEINIYLDEKYIDTLTSDHDNIMLSNDLSMGTHEVKLIYNYENNIRPSVETTFNLIRENLTRPEINLYYNYTISAIEDKTVNWDFDVVNPETDEIIETGNVTLYIKNLTAKNYIEFKTVNATDNFHIDINEIINLTDTDYYPKYYDFYIQYNGDNITYGQSIRYGGSTLTIISNKKSYLTYLKYEVSDEGTKIYYNLTDSKNEKINTGEIYLSLYLCEDYENDPNTHYYHYGLPYSIDESTGIDENYLLIPEFNLTEHIGSHADLSLRYENNEEYYWSFDSWYDYLRINLTYEFPEEIHTKLNQIIPLSINFTDENNNTHYPKGEIVIWGPSTIEYSVPIIRDFKNPLLNISEITETPGTYNLEIIYENSYWGYDEIEGQKYIVDPKYMVMDTKKNCTLIISNETIREQKIEINPITSNLGETINITAQITENNELMTNLSKGKVTFKVNGKTLKDTNGKVIYAKVVNGTATIENYLVPSDWAKDGTTIQAVYSGSTECEKLTSEKTNITIAKAVPTLTTEDVTATAGDKITLKATITDNNKVINTGKIVFKINGKTVKDENGKVIYAKVVNNTVEFEYTLPESFKAGMYNITATFISPDYNRLNDSKTLTIN